MLLKRIRSPAHDMAPSKCEPEGIDDVTLIEHVQIVSFSQIRLFAIKTITTWIVELAELNWQLTLSVTTASNVLFEDRKKKMGIMICSPNIVLAAKWLCVFE